MFAARSENYLCMVVNLHVMHTVSNVSPFKHDTLLASKCVVIYIPCKKVQDSCFSIELCTFLSKSAAAHTRHHAEPVAEMHRCVFDSVRDPHPLHGKLKGVRSPSSFEGEV